MIKLSCLAIIGWAFLSAVVGRWDWAFFCLGLAIAIKFTLEDSDDK